MGKSTKKWIKTVIFRKKSSKSGLSKKVAVKESVVASKGSSGDMALSPPVIPDPVSCASDRNDTEGIVGLYLQDPSEVIRQEQAATVVQAAFRGYLARRSFHVLKGIIRLQALIRGHLVRRQAVSTLYCIQQIVKLQTLIRGQRFRVMDDGPDVLTKCSPERFLVDPLGLDAIIPPEKLYANVFIRKLLASSPTAMPLNLHYDVVEPNSAWNWLERWSSFLYKESCPQKKQALDSRSHQKQPSIQSMPTAGRQKRGLWKIPAVNANNNSSHPFSEPEKPGPNLRKALSHHTEFTKETPPTELEKVRQNLRKISAPSAGATKGSEAVTEKPNLSPRKVVTYPAHNILGKVADKKRTMDPVITEAKDFESLDPETSPKQLVMKETVTMQNENLPAAQTPPLENHSADDTHVVDEELNPKGEESSKDNLRIRRRKSSVKQEYQEKVSQNAPTVPSYMVATESAKAKLRGQGSPRFGQDGVENSLIRRQSLPACNNNKLSLVSPQTQRQVHANSKGRSKADRSLLSTKDGNETAGQPAWRR